VYQALNARYSSNTSLQWQVPLYVLPVEAALIVGITATEGFWALGLGVIAAAIGLVGVPVMWRIESVARWDRQALDEFEAILLPAQDAGLRLMHSAHFNVRLDAKPLKMARSRFADFFEQRVLKYFPPSRTIGFLLGFVGLVALGMGIQRSSVSASPQSEEPSGAHSVLVRQHL
jgi:hypothetical protein